jgi:hypothetical protein
VDELRRTGYAISKAAIIIGSIAPLDPDSTGR